MANLANPKNLKKPHKSQNPISQRGARHTKMVILRGILHIDLNVMKWA